MPTHVTLPIPENEPNLVNWFKFSSTEARDTFLKRNFPHRKGDANTPGFYYLPDGSTLSVFMDEVRQYRYQDGLINSVEYNYDDTALRTELAMLAQLLAKHRGLINLELEGHNLSIHQVFDYSNELHCGVKAELRVS